MPDGSMTQRRVTCQASFVTCHSSLPLSPSRRRARALPLDLRLAGAAGLRALGFGWPLLPCFAFQFLAFGVVFDFLSVHSQRSAGVSRKRARPRPTRAACGVKRTSGSEASNFLQGRKFFNELLGPI